jgi:hypothetical protein
MVMCACHPRYSGKCEIGELWFRLAWAKSKAPISKTTAEMAGGLVQEVEHLPRKCEALSSNPSTAKKKKIIELVKIPLYRSS